MGKALRPYQLQMLRYALSTEYPALFVDMRLGKTIVTVRWALLRGYRRVLVVGPYSCFASWRDELDEMKQEYVQLTGPRDARERLLANSNAVRWVLTNIESHLSIGGALLAVKWDCVIIDESRMIANPQAAITQFYVNNFRFTSGRMVLSGLPAPESELEYHQQLAFLSPNIVGNLDYYKWRHRYFTQPIDGDAHAKWFLRGNRKNEFARMLATNTFHLKRKDVNLGREKIYSKISIALPPKWRKVYDTAEDEFILEMAGEEIDNTIYSITAYTWLRRIAGGLIEGNVWPGKAVEVLKLAEQEHQLVVWCEFHDEIDYLVNYLKSMGRLAYAIDGRVRPTLRDGLYEQFKRRMINVLVCQPRSFRYGVDLGMCTTEMYYSSPTSLEVREQSEDRAVRVDDRAGVHIIDLVTDDTVDEDIVKAIRRKRRRVELLHDIIAGVRQRADNRSRR